MSGPSDVIDARPLARVGGEYGIVVDGADDVLLDRVQVVGAKMDGIHVRRSPRDDQRLPVDSPGGFTQGIDISFSADMGMSMVDGLRSSAGARASSSTRRWR